MNNPDINPETIPVGVVGLGLMGCSIATCLLMAGHPVKAIAPMPADLVTALPRIQSHLIKSFEEKLTSHPPEFFLSRLTITDDYSQLSDCRLVIECIIENLELKNLIHSKIEAIVADDALITSNTSAIPITILQRDRRLPSRFFGLHWAEPSHTTRFLEIICGELSDKTKAQWMYALAHYWQKEPTLLLKDIRGFITNRLMYSMYREACYLVENGYASIEDVDRACRNNAGYWMTLVGVFRWMDLTGVDAYYTVMKDLFPTLNNQTTPPVLIEKVVTSGGRGVSNQNGFYQYSPEEAEMWKETFEEFSFEINRLARKYPIDIVERKLEKQKKA